MPRSCRQIIGKRTPITDSYLGGMVFGFILIMYWRKKNRGNDYQGKLLVTIPFDQQLFRKETIGKVVVMGRKTLESLPIGKRFYQLPVTPEKIRKALAL